MTARMRGNLSRRDFSKLTLAATLTLTGCAQKEEPTEEPLVEVHVPGQESAPEAPKQPEAEEPAPEEPAEESPQAPLPATFDLHADTLDVLAMNDYEPYASFTTKHYGDFVNNDAQVAVANMGQMHWAQAYAVWIPDYCPSISHHGYYRAGADFFASQMEALSDRIERVVSFADVDRILSEDKVAALFTVENAACLEDGLQVVDEFVADGVKIAGFTWNGVNALGSGYETSMGLTELGKQYAMALESARIVADVSHLNEQGFWDLEAQASLPYIATHSNSKSVCGAARNLTDDQFGAIVARGGLVGLNFETSFVGYDGTYGADELFAHVEHWLDLGGQDVIALGSDRDGSNIPSWLADCSQQMSFYQAAVDHLGQEIADKLFFTNARDFFLRYETL